MNLLIYSSNAAKDNRCHPSIYLFYILAIKNFDFLVEIDRSLVIGYDLFHLVKL